MYGNKIYSPQPEAYLSVDVRGKLWYVHRIGRRGSQVRACTLERKQVLLEASSWSCSTQ